MITISDVSYRYPHARQPALQHLSLQIDEGEFLLVCGSSGAGKSTLLRLLNGLVPHFYGGHFAGEVRLWGRSTLATQPRELADLVGFVFQDPEAQFVVDRVEDELAFGMENLGVPQVVMRRRIEEVLDQLSIAHLRRRRISSLSGGEKQRVAIAAVLAAQARMLVLDEPTSQLDPHGAEEVLTALQKLNADLGLTIVLCEHRLERVVQYVDRILYLPRPDEQSGERAIMLGPPRAMLAKIPLVPPLQALGRHLHWEPLPLTIKEGRRFTRQIQPSPPPPLRPPVQPETALRLTNVVVRYNERVALDGITLSVQAGQLLALMGRNGSGKSTLLRTVAGLVKLVSGRIELFGRDTARIALEERTRYVGYVPQDPRSILFHDTLREELAFTLQARGEPVSDSVINTTLALLEIEHLAEVYPRSLSGGEAQRAALAAILVGKPRLMLLDEPTRGLDYAAKEVLTRLLRELCRAGHSVVMATHDVELVAGSADRVVLLGDGELVVDGAIREVLGESMIHSSQIAKLFPKSGWLTVSEALGGLNQK